MLNVFELRGKKLVFYLQLRYSTRNPQLSLDSAHLPLENLCARACHTSLGQTVRRRKPAIIPDSSCHGNVNVWNKTFSRAACHTSKGKSSGGKVPLGVGSMEIITGTLSVWDMVKRSLLRLHGLLLLRLACLRWPVFNSSSESLILTWELSFKLQPHVLWMLAVGPETLSIPGMHRHPLSFLAYQASLDWVWGPDFDSCLSVWFIKRLCE